MRLDTHDGLFGDLGEFKVVASGDLEKSELFYRISHEDPEERMPPKEADRHLNGSETALIEKWISEAGSEMERSVFRSSSQAAWTRVQLSKVCSVV